MTRIFPNIAPVLRTGCELCELNTVQYWGFFSRKDLRDNPGKLLMLDIDLGRDCSLRCPWCFRRKHHADHLAPGDLSYEALLEIIDDARMIGLREVKICGAGEPLENPDLLRFARDLTDRGIGVAVFTKGHVFGDDSAVESVFGGVGIANGDALASAFFELRTSFLVGFQAATPAVQDALVGNVRGYTVKRNLGLERLAKAGFNKSTPTRLALCTNPLMRQNYDEIFDIYVYARKRNILPVVAMMMVSGEQIGPKFLSYFDVGEQEKEQLFRAIYTWNRNHRLQTTGELLRDGVYCLPGIHPCNQIAAGLYVMANGAVVRCPGDTNRPLGNITEVGIATIWEKACDWRFQGCFNCGCPYKEGATIPSEIFKRTLRWAVETDMGVHPRQAVDGL